MLFLTGRLAISTGIALTCSTMFVGGNAVITYLTLPSLLLSPPSRGTSEASSESSQPATHSDHLARQWQSVYDLGKKVGPAVTLPGVAALLSATPVLRRSSRILFLLAVALNLSIIPFTLGVMAKTNNELIRRANAASEGLDASPTDRATGVEKYQTPELVRWWGTLNVYRASLQVGAMGCVVLAVAL